MDWAIVVAEKAGMVTQAMAAKPTDKIFRNFILFLLP
jgi:hypothetical protein